MTTVTVVSCAYGGHLRFVPRWMRSLYALHREPDDVILTKEGAGTWRHRQAGLLDQAIRQASTEWVWVLDVDDEALPTGLNGIDEVDADVWLTGYVRDDGTTYVPRRLTNSMYLALTGNPYTGASAFRRDVYLNAGGFADVAFQDWALWRRLAQDHARFAVSGRANFIYHQHAETRSATELTRERRAAHEAEMREAL